MSAPDVDILLSTFNGAKYLEEQIASLLSQSHQSWKLIARDDGSTDGTPEILRAWVEKDKRIVLVPAPQGNLGVRDAFFALLGESRAPRFMFCDQDDVWLPEKIALTLSALGNASLDRPAAVFTDLRVVDERTGPVADSFMRAQNIDVVRASEWPRLVTQNIVVGCTLVGNAALRAKALVPSTAQREGAILHDGWLALIAKSMGRLTFLDRPTVLYRQHGANVLGAKRGGVARYMANFRRGEGARKAVRYFRRISRQADAFRTCYGAELPVGHRAILDCLAEACSPNGHAGFSGWFRSWRNGARMTSWDQDLAVALSVLLFGGSEEGT